MPIVAASVTFGKSQPPGAIGGTPFKSWTAPRTLAGWQKLANAAPKVPEPPLPLLPAGLTRGAGVIIREPDGRVWLIKPTGGFGGYDHTFPKGRADQDLTLQATAMKEAFEETGLQVEITGFAGDVLRSTSLARYYFAKRVGGSPVDAGWEAEGVTLAAPDELNKYLNTSVDRSMVRQFLSAQPTEGGLSGPLKLSDLKKVDQQLGSTPGGKYEDASGKAYYVKLSESNARAKNEILASKLYEAAGSPILKVLEVDMGGGRLGTATAWQKVTHIDRGDATQRKLAQAEFATHAWLSNWDAVGLEYDNQGMIDAKMHTLEPGGSLLFRARGNPKGATFGTTVGEWNTLRDPSNRRAHTIFGSMTTEDLKRSATKVVNISDQSIRQMVEVFGPGDDSQKTALAEILIARKRNIAKRAGLAVADDDTHAVSPLD